MNAETKQKLFDYLSDELGTITLDTDLFAIERIIENGRCNGNCGMNYCDENGCIDRKRHLVDTVNLAPQVLA